MGQTCANCKCNLFNGTEKEEFVIYPKTVVSNLNSPNQESHVSIDDVAANQKPFLISIIKLQALWKGYNTRKIYSILLLQLNVIPISRT